MSSRPEIPRWLLELRISAERLADLFELGGSVAAAHPQEFQQREQRLLTLLLQRSREIVRALEAEAGIHESAPPSKNVIEFAERKELLAQQNHERNATPDEAA